MASSKKASFFTYLLSFLGYISVFVGLVVAAVGNFVTGIVIALVGAAAALISWQISSRNFFRAWWKQIEDANLEDAIRADVTVAMRIYTKNPSKRTLKKIRTLNPQAADMIEEAIGKK